MLGGAVTALFLAQAIPADAVTIDSLAAPTVINVGDQFASLHQTLPTSHSAETTAFDISILDPASNGQDLPFSLTSDELAGARNGILSGAPASLLLARRDRHATSFSLLHVDSNHPIAMEDLTTGERFALPVQLVIMTAAGVALLFLSLLGSYHYLQRPRGKRVRFGILWHAYKPICGRCGSRLAVLNDYSFQCPSCQVELGARGENGHTIAPHEALLMIRRKENW